MLLTLALLACSPLVPNLHLDFTTQTPVDVDTIADDTNQDGVVGGYTTELIWIYLELDSDPYSTPGVVQPTIELDHYSISYRATNADATTPEMPDYESGFTMHIDNDDEGGEGYNYQSVNSVGFPLRAVSYVQKDWAHAQFDGAPMNYVGTLTLTGTASNGVDVQETGNFDLIFADFQEPG